MDKLTYTRDFDKQLANEDVDIREATEITFTFPDDMTIEEYKIVCIRLASALGYADVNIQEYFGDEPDEKKSSLINRIQRIE